LSTKILLLIALLCWLIPYPASANIKHEPLIFSEWSLTEPAYVTRPYYEEFRQAPPKKTPPTWTNGTVSNGYNPCSCVSFAKYKTGYTASVGNARNWPVNTTTQIGAVVVTYESAAGHVGIVTDVQDGYIIISEANYSRCKVTHGRRLPVGSNLIKGFYL